MCSLDNVGNSIIDALVNPLKAARVTGNFQDIPSQEECRSLFVHLKKT